MRLLGLILSSALVLTAFGSSVVHAEKKDAKKAGDSAKDDDLDDLDLVPLVNLNAPLAIVWTSENDDVSMEDATAIDNQLFEDLSARRDIRLFSRERTLRIVDESGDKRLMHCKWEDPCLVGIAKLAKADMVIGVKLTGTKEQYFMAFKLIRVGDKPGKVMKISSGQLSSLLVGGISKTLDSVIKSKAVPMKKLPDLPPEKAQAPAPIIPGKQLAKQKPPESQNDTRAMSATTKVKSLPQAPKVQIVAPSPVDEVKTQAESPGFFNRHLGSVIATGIGLALAGAGVGFGVAADSAKQDVEFQWDPAKDDSGRSNALAANILFGLSGVSIIAAIVLFVIEPSTEDYRLSASSDGPVAVFRF